MCCYKSSVIQTQMVKSTITTNKKTPPLTNYNKISKKISKKEKNINSKTSDYYQNKKGLYPISENDDSVSSSNVISNIKSRKNNVTSTRFTLRSILNRLQSRFGL